MKTFREISHQTFVFLVANFLLVTSAVTVERIALIFKTHLRQTLKAI
jgi:hypothetical protein